MEQARRLGARGVETRVANLTEALSEDLGLFDRVLLDAPCSGLGVLRRHPELLLRRSEGDLGALAATQRRMLDVVAARVRPGGALTYAVCTFERAECEDVVEAFLTTHPEFRLEPPATVAGGVPWERVLEAGGTVRTWPQRDDADAFFAARMRRADTPPE
jgi:16S rRNA (cytosine967-C5)-methyltransferase